mmetsp:Transcript_11657/g.17418  ORF Transcript_11657/g.17418 Transcript_11657/m.17418 type:complete len:361 (-) Transcript_11657:10-1092(-)
MMNLNSSVMIAESEKMANWVPKVVPWSNWSEFTSMYKALYGPNPELGISRMAIWRLRGNVPQSIEATVQLVSLANCTGETGRLALAMTTIRCVNGVVDKLQKGKHAVNIEHLAVEAKLPHWLVEIRHQATHNALPSLQVLRAARCELLKYLDCTYWQAQLKALKRDRLRIEKVLENSATIASLPAVSYAQLLLPIFLRQIPQDTNVLDSIRCDWPGVDQALTTALVDHMLSQNCNQPLDRCELWLSVLLLKCDPVYLNQLWSRATEENHVSARSRLIASIIASLIAQTAATEKIHLKTTEHAFASIQQAEQAVFNDPAFKSDIDSTYHNAHLLWRPATSEDSLLPIGTTILPSAGDASFF